MGSKIKNVIPELEYSHSLPGNQTSLHQRSCSAHCHTQYRFPCRDCPCSSTAFCYTCWEVNKIRFTICTKHFFFLNLKHGQNNGKVNLLQCSKAMPYNGLLITKIVFSTKTCLNFLYFDSILSPSNII